MVSQGLFGALEQYWTIEDKPRLTRRNTYFEDKDVSNDTALKFGLVVSVLVTTIVIFGQIGVML